MLWWILLGWASRLAVFLLCGVIALLVLGLVLIEAGASEYSGGSDPQHP